MSANPGPWLPARRRAARLRHRLAGDTDVLSLPTGPAGGPWLTASGPVTSAELAGLPAAARTYLRFMGAAGRPADWSFVAHCTGRFRLRPGWPWLPCVTWQYNSALEVARIFHLRIGAPPMTARDAYVRGQGSMAWHAARRGPGRGRPRPGV